MTAQAEPAPLRVRTRDRLYFDMVVAALRSTGAPTRLHVVAIGGEGCDFCDRAATRLVAFWRGERRHRPVLCSRHMATARAEASR